VSITNTVGTICYCLPCSGGLNESVSDLKRHAITAGAPVVSLAASPHDRARGMIAAKALETGCEWLVWVDSDMVCTLAEVASLAATGEAHGFDLVTGVYICRHLAAEGKRAFNFSPEVGGDFQMGTAGGLYPILSCGFGAVAVRRSVFERIDAPACEYGKAWFLPMVHQGYHLGEDRSFGVRAKQAGCEMYVDTRVMVGHEGKKVWRAEDFR
jgi:GT2 family glycosyltransferase